jgi:hypothetical protein
MKMPRIAERAGAAGVRPDVLTLVPRATFPVTPRPSSSQFLEPIPPAFSPAETARAMRASAGADVRPLLLRKGISSIRKTGRNP